MDERDRLTRELERIEVLRDKERIIEDYGLGPLLSTLYAPSDYS